MAVSQNYSNTVSTSLQHTKKTYVPDSSQEVPPQTFLLLVFLAFFSTAEQVI